MRPPIAVVVLLLALAAPLSAQVVTPSPQGINAVSSGVTNCIAGNCATWALPSTGPSFTSQITGTMTSLTLTAEGTTDNLTWFTIQVVKLADGTLVTTTTSTGQFAIPNTGLVGFRWRCTTYVSGGANISLTRGAASSAHRANDASLITGTLPANHGGTGQSSYAVGDLLSADTTTALSKVAAVAVGQVFASAGTSTLPAWSDAPTLTNSVTINRAATGTSNLVGLGCKASTAAALGAQQDSCLMQLAGNGWNNTSNASHVADAVFRVRPVQGNPVTSNIFLQQSINGGAYSVVGTWTNVGAYTAQTSLTATTLVSAGTTVNATTNYLNGGNIAYNGSAATLTSGFSTTTPTVTGKASSFNVLIAATPGVTGTVGFATSFTNAPNCHCNNSTIANACFVNASVSAAVITGIWTDGNLLTVTCLGF